MYLMLGSIQNRTVVNLSCCNILNIWTSAMRKHPLPLCPSSSYFTRPPSPLRSGVLCEWPLISIPKIYSKPIVDSPLGHSDHCLITLQHDHLIFRQDMSFSIQNVFEFNNADWDSLRTFYFSYPWYSGFFNDPSSFATFFTN